MPIMTGMLANLDLILCSALPMLLTMCERVRMKEFKAYGLLMHLRCKEAKMPPRASKGLSYAAIFGMPVFVYFTPVVVGQCALLFYAYILWRSTLVEKKLLILVEEEYLVWQIKVAEKRAEDLEAKRDQLIAERDKHIKLLEEQQKEREALATEMLEEAIKKHPELEVLREALEEIKKNS